MPGSYQNLNQPKKRYTNTIVTLYIWGICDKKAFTTEGEIGEENNDWGNSFATSRKHFGTRKYNKMENIFRLVAKRFFIHQPPKDCRGSWLERERRPLFANLLQRSAKVGTPGFVNDAGMLRQKW